MITRCDKVAIFSICQFECFFRKALEKKMYREPWFDGDLTDLIWSDQLLLDTISRISKSLEETFTYLFLIPKTSSPWYLCTTLVAISGIVIEETVIVRIPIFSFELMTFIAPFFELFSSFLLVTN